MLIGLAGFGWLAYRWQMQPSLVLEIAEDQRNVDQVLTDNEAPASTGAGRR